MDALNSEKNNRFFLRNGIIQTIDEICDISRRQLFNIKESLFHL